MAGGGNYKLGKLVIEGKTKKVWALEDSPDLVYVESKDRITAGDGVKAHDLEGKAAVSNRTNCKVFELLNSVGLKTSFVKHAGEKAFIAKKCEMVPIEWVTRRLATGSFLKRHPGVPEGYRFNPPLQETFYKDDANHDPQWSEEQIISANFNLNGVVIGQDEVDIMCKTTVVVFEVLEKAWAEKDCALIDMKIEFGIDSSGQILISDVIDSDSWRLWPSGDKRLMKDKQVYRNLSKVTDEDLATVKRNFIWVAEQLETIIPVPKCLVVILMGSPADEKHSSVIADNLKAMGIPCEMRVTSAHKNTDEALKITAFYEGCGQKVVFIAVAGRSNGLGPVLSGNTSFPVINCPPVRADNVAQDIWSSLNIPSGLGCTTVVYPEAAALAAAQIHGLCDYVVWSRLRVKKLQNFINLKVADKKMRNLNVQ
ncbi:bifunctional phosphoribosylaminoimidazole carboxylase/phosphoribosylaminoimidazole succinocarboxamide synthetase [Schistocerca cancellata]|uniref:bifunctional phosphoribosylaminoimidazole carboxylase/phosphoribosylaminoimidazole succinocarboxamide synthetase n=1 Tax=Schistocerca cancellata TaxID=274614 RepID=UPI0021176497|nr:bifunctional phosphoribosylaminoimidazole carboxylase/phosphoribosylaminoimidazole succinocarboxamide synthetase [Schistocerca cancellata]